MGPGAQLPSNPSVPFTPVAKVLAESVHTSSVSYSSLETVLIRDLTRPKGWAGVSQKGIVVWWLPLCWLQHGQSH